MLCPWPIAPNAMTGITACRYLSRFATPKKGGWGAPPRWPDTNKGYSTSEPGRVLKFLQDGEWSKSSQLQA